MSDTSEQIQNSSLDSLPFEECLKVNHLEFVFHFVLMTLCVFVATPAHLWCLWFYFCSKRKIKDTQVLFQNHIVMEIIYCLECNLEIIAVFFVDNKILWYVVYFLFGLSWFGRPLLQTCICVEQYLAVIHPVTFLRYKGVKYRIAVAVAAWLVAFAYGVYEIYAAVFPDILFTFIFVIALAVISFCCVSVLCALKQPGPGDTHTPNQTGKDGGNQQKRNAFNTIFSALILILFSYLPQAILIIYHFFKVQANQSSFQCNLNYLTMSLNVLSVIISPTMKLYKEGYLKCLKHLK